MEADGDGPGMVGVRYRGYALEIKKWREGENIYRDVKASKEEAAMVHDLARFCSDPPVEEQRLRLNNETIARRIGGDLALNVYKNFLIEFLERHPVAVAGETAKERADAVMKAVVELAPAALQELEIKLSRAGRLRQVEPEILPKVEVNEPANLEDENKRLEDQIACMKEAHAEQIACMKVAHAEQIAALVAQKECDDIIIALLQEIIDNGERKFGPSFFGAL